MQNNLASDQNVIDEVERTKWKRTGMTLLRDWRLYVLLIPIMLFLAWPELIGRKNTWLKAWFLTGLLHGLYYPVFGAAVCIGFFPLGAYQLVSYIRDEFI